MTVPYAFGAATSAIPLSQLDSNFNTPITLGNTAIQLGNTVTTLNNMTLANVTVSSGNVTITNVTVTTANATTVNTTTLIATTANVTTGNVTNLISGNVSLTGGTITGTPISGSTGSFTTLTTSSTVTLNGGTAGGVAYLDGSKVLTTGSALTYNGSTFKVTGQLNVNSDTNYLAMLNAADSVYWGRISQSGSDIEFYNRQVGALKFGVSDTEQMRLTSTGLGIGTSSPAQKLHVLADTSGALFQGATLGGVTFLKTGQIGMQLFSDATGTLKFYDNNAGATQLTLASGNLGLGVTPSAWSQGRAFELLNPGYGFWNGSGSPASMYMLANAYYNGGFKYGGTGQASHYYQYQGAHVWSTAASGTAGNAITFTQAMTLDASGQLGVGTTSPSAPLHVSGSGSLEVARFATTTNNTPSIGIYSDGSIRAKLRASSAETALLSQGALPLLLGTNDTERARITSGGEVYIAGTTDQGAYNLQVNGTGVWGAGAYVNGSDANLKEEVQDLAPALDVIASLRPVTFRYKEEYSKDQNVQPGFIAQELQTAMAGQVYVDGVIQTGPQHLNVAYQSLIPLLTKAIQELKAEFDAYKASHP